MKSPRKFGAKDPNLPVAGVLPTGHHVDPSGSRTPPVIRDGVENNRAMEGFLPERAPKAPAFRPGSRRTIL